ncbi:MAG TPA: glycosyltransferase [Acidimicrobiales bacterium]|nr:glycosyltransferase [Acidimicrobiales bacterium]
MARPLRVVLVGQTPPPVHGQSLMIEHALAGAYRDVRLHHVRLAFASSVEDIGRPRPGKVAHLAGAVARIVRARLRLRAQVLYYHPAGPSRLPVYRDIALLLSTRWMFGATVLHFHAGGVSELYPELGRVARWLYRRAYFGADVGIRTSALAPDDPGRLGARRQLVVPNGLPDASAQVAATSSARRAEEPPTVLFVAHLWESKGLPVLLEAAGQLLGQGVRFRVEVVGAYPSRDVEERTRRAIAHHGLDDVVVERGPLRRDEVLGAYARADVFCFPSFYEAETFGVVLLEAMQFGLPVVATRWRGIPTVVDDGVTGYLVPVRDSAALADRLGRLLQDEGLARRMGAAGRAAYEERFTLERFHRDLQAVFDSLREHMR